MANQLKQPKRTHARNIVTRAVIFHGCAQGFFHFKHVLLVAHFDEVDHHLPADIAQLEVARNGVGGFHIGFVRHGLKVALAGNFARVDVDGTIL